MRTRRRLLYWLPLVVASPLGGCVSVQLPAISHVHAGHAVTGWPDTPGKRGLFDVAIEDAAFAAQHAGYAVEGARDVAAVKIHLRHVLHALDPATESTGPGTGYGLIRALDGTLDHLAFAQEAGDASANLRGGLARLRDAMAPLRQETRIVKALALEAYGSGDGAQVVAYAEEIRNRAARMSEQLVLRSRELNAILGSESPPYQPVAQRYLFGLIRLPSGQWSFDTSLQPARAGSYY